MELALLLIVVVLVELVLTVWQLGKVKDYRRRVARLERNVQKMAEVLADMAGAQGGSPLPLDDDASSPSLSDLVAKATPEDIAQANAILAAIGVNKD